MNIEQGSTKERIFDTAIRLIAQNGFESVSMRDLANKVGIKAASIYNHFSGKEEILDTIYQYFGEHRMDGREDVQRMQTVMETGSTLDVLTAFIDPPLNFEEKIAVRMVLIPKIILMRIFNDARANQFFLHEWFETDMKHLKKWLGYAAEIGRLAKDFDIESFSVFFWRQLIIMGIWAFADPNYEVRRLEEEGSLLSWFAGMLPLEEPIGLN